MLARTGILLLAGTLAACSPGQTDNLAAGDVQDSAGVLDSIAGTAAASLNEASVIGLLRYVHAADSALGALGAQRGSTRDIRDFGLMIVREHMALRREAATLADGLNLEIQEPRVAPAQVPESMTAALVATPDGPGWDRAYVDYSLDVHQASMENTARALAATKSPATRQYIERMVPILQKHIDKAESLRKALAATDTKRDR